MKSKTTERNYKNLHISYTTPSLADSTFITAEYRNSNIRAGVRACFYLLLYANTSHSWYRIHAMYLC